MRKSLIIVCGLPYSGKSTMAEGIAKTVKLPLLSVDPIESAILHSGIPRTEKTGLAAYLVAENLAAEQLKAGNSVILDAVSGAPKAKAAWRQLARAYKARLVIIECYCSDTGLHRQRREQRGRELFGIPELSEKEFQAYAERYSPWPENHLRLNAADSVISNAAKALAYLNTAQ